MRTMHYGLLFLILTGAAAVRVYDLGGPAFWIDELYHVYAAHSLVENGTLSVPWHGMYTRSLPTTYIASLAFRLFGESEWSARILFVIINLIFIGVGFMVIKKYLSKTIALLFALFMGFAPLAVVTARDCRMYGLFQLLYFLMVVACFIGLENIPTRWSGFQKDGWLKRFEEKWDIHVGWLSIAGVLFIVSLMTHQLTVNFCLPLTAYLLVMALWVGKKEGLKQALISKYGLLLLVEILGVIAGVIFVRDKVLELVDLITSLPLHFRYINPQHDYSFYRHILFDVYPGIIFLYPLGAFLLIKLRGKWGLYLVLQFVVLFLVHSFIFELKADRYIFYAFPFLIIGAGQAVEWLITMVRTAGQTNWKMWPRLHRFALLMCSLPLLLIFVRPWMIDTLKRDVLDHAPNWKAIDPARRQVVVDNVSISANPMEQLYYFKKAPEYYLLLEVNPRDLERQKWIQTQEEFFDAAEKQNNTVVITSRFTYANPVYFTPGMIHYIERNMEPVGNTPDTQILIFKKKTKDKAKA